MLGPLAERLVLRWEVDASEQDTFGVSVVRNFNRVTIADANKFSSELSGKGKTDEREGEEGDGDHEIAHGSHASRLVTISREDHCQFGRVPNSLLRC